MNVSLTWKAPSLPDCMRISLARVCGSEGKGSEKVPLETTVRTLAVTANSSKYNATLSSSFSNILIPLYHCLGEERYIPANQPKQTHGSHLPLHSQPTQSRRHDDLDSSTHGLASATSAWLAANIFHSEPLLIHFPEGTSDHVTTQNPLLLPAALRIKLKFLSMVDSACQGLAFNSVGSYKI